MRIMNVSMFVLISVCVLLGGCMQAQKWTQRTLLTEAIGATACDYGQTSWMADGGAYDHGGLYERDPLLGSAHPSPTVIAVAPVVAIGGMVAAYETLPNKWRWALVVAVSVVETANVAMNAEAIERHGGKACGDL